MADETLTIAVRDGVSVTALRTRAAGDGDVLFLYAPGAGSNLRDPFGAYLAAHLPAEGVELWRFQFPYMEQGRKGPDAAPLLQTTWRAVIERAQAESRLPVVIGGRSMGGRIASMVVADGAAVAGLALFAYPLVPPGRTATPRSEHLPRIAVPTLFCSGTRDNFGTPEQLEAAVALVPGATLHLLEGADHGFAVLKASGRTRDAAWAEATEALLRFLAVLRA